MASTESSFDVGAAVAKELGEMWEFAKTDTFAMEMSRRYGQRFEKPNWRKLIIAEAHEANFEEMYFESSLIKRFWLVDDGGLREAIDPMGDDRECGMFYETPWIRFCANTDYLLVCERLGPKFMLRRLHKLSIAAGRLCISVPVTQKVF